MSKQKPTLEELRKLRDKLAKDLSDLQHEEQMVLASISNPEHMVLMNELRNMEKPPKHISELKKAQNTRKQETEMKNQINENKLINYHRIISGVTVNKASIKTLPISEDPEDKCIYLYETDANIESLRFNLTYRSNKPPDIESQANEKIKQLTINLDKSVYQPDIQEGLDFFSQHPIIPSAILFLKSVNNLINIRKNICNSLHADYKKYIQIFKSDEGFLSVKCTGILHPECYFTIDWHIKFDETNYSAKDSLNIMVACQDKQFEEDAKPIFNKIVKHNQWKILSYNEKHGLFVRAMLALVTADSRQVTSDSISTLVSEYSSVM